MGLLERDDALAALTEAHADAARGEGRVILVTGEPGIGKTALVETVLASLPGETRALVGRCDDLTVARPLSPFADLLGSVPAALEEAILDGAPPQRLHPLLLAEVDLQSRPTVLVVEDVHWADDATLDALTFLVRRVGRIRALVVLTLRPGEAPPGSAVNATLGEIPPANAGYLDLEPLSEAAVASLAGETAPAVFAATRGNPFYVTQLIEADDPSDIPPSVAHVVGARAARLEPDARRLVELVAVVPRRIATRVLDRAFPDWPAAAADPERRHLLDVGPLYVAFRHELVRDAVRAGLPASRQRQLHAEVLAALLDTGADPADIVHHAAAAGADEIVAEHVLVAARRAAASQANRQAWAHYQRAADFRDRYAPAERAAILDELAAAAHLVGRFGDAIAATKTALELWRELGDEPALGRGTLFLSRMHWFAGDGALARSEAAEAAAIFERSGDALGAAAATGYRARLAMFAADSETATALAERTRELADAADSDEWRIHALVTLSSIRQMSRPDPAPALAAYDQALAAGFTHEAHVALGNSVHALVTWGHGRVARTQVDRAVADAERYELHHFAAYSRMMSAWLDAREGRWDAAARAASAEVTRGGSISGLLAEAVLAEIAVRRGAPDAEERLEALERAAERTGELERLVPALDLRVEQTLTLGAPSPTQLIAQMSDQVSRDAHLALRVAAAARLAGLDVPEHTPLPSPYSFVAAGDWRGAADAFGDEGWRYERALFLSFADDAGSLGQALATARELGAEPLAGRVSARMRELGHAVPRGPRRTTQANAAGLTPRQVEVLELVVAGLSNLDIAERLVLSERTVEHHVAAVLRKLGTTSRHAAARRAAELGVLG
jgi:DNA-binding CsgD family transcriptional regulator